MKEKTTVIDSSSKSIQFKALELWEYKDLLSSIAWRDIRVKYAQTFLGFLWSLLNPLLSLGILFIVFGKVVKVDTGEVPHIVFTMCGLVAWNYFAHLVSEGGNSLLNNRELLSKIYFPRLIIPLSKGLSGLLDFTISLVILLILFIYQSVTPSSNIIYLPIFLFFILITGLTAGIWISALNVRFRDFRFITPVILQLGLYATPIAYSIQNIPDNLRIIFYLNPLTGLVNGFRWCLLDSAINFNYLIISMLYILILFVLGIIFFNHVDKTVADII